MVSIDQVVAMISVEVCVFACVLVAAGCRGFLTPPPRAEEEEAAGED